MRHVLDKLDRLDVTVPNNDLGRRIDEYQHRDYRDY
jgi:hypothetical protein